MAFKNSVVKRYYFVFIHVFFIMFYRRKIILGLLEAFGNELEKIRLQKLLFLLSRQQAMPDYDFVPYKFSCYSFSANADLTAMVKKGILTETESDFRKNYANLLSLIFRCRKGELLFKPGNFWPYILILFNLLAINT